MVSTLMTRSCPTVTLAPTAPWTLHNVYLVLLKEDPVNRLINVLTLFNVSLTDAMQASRHGPLKAFQLLISLLER